MNNVIMRKIDVTVSYAPLADSGVVASVTISTPPTNVANVLFKCPDGQDIPWVPGEWHDFRHVNLADIEIKGTAGDMVTVIGGTW